MWKCFVFSCIPQDERWCVNCAFAIIVDIGRGHFTVYTFTFVCFSVVCWCFDAVEVEGERGARNPQQPASQRCGVLGWLEEQCASCERVRHELAPPL